MRKREDGRAIRNPRVACMNLGDVAASHSWSSKVYRPYDHASAVDTARARRTQPCKRDLRSERPIFAEPISAQSPTPGVSWPMHSTEPPPFPPPWPSEAKRRMMREESASSHAEAPLGPLAAAWQRDLQCWYTRLQVHFGFDPSDLPANLRKNSDKWRFRLQYLKEDQPELFDSVMRSIVKGHSIPFGEAKPDKFFRRRNPPSLAGDKVRAWAAIRKDMAHGALVPVNLPKDGMPRCVCPVRTADKNDGTARFVVSGGGRGWHGAHADCLSALTC